MLYILDKYNLKYIIFFQINNIVFLKLFFIKLKIFSLIWIKKILQILILKDSFWKFNNFWVNSKILLKENYNV